MYVTIVRVSQQTHIRTRAHTHTPIHTRARIHTLTHTVFMYLQQYYFWYTHMLTHVVYFNFPFRTCLKIKSRWRKFTEIPDAHWTHTG